MASSPETPEELTPEFHSYPKLHELLVGDGIPGFEYYHVHLTNIPKAEQSKLKLVSGLGTYKIIGPKGEASAVLMCRGERLVGVRNSTVRQPVYADKQLQDLTGIMADGSNKPAGKDELEAVKAKLAQAKKADNITVDTTPTSASPGTD
jgi:hypothetical protein